MPLKTVAELILELSKLDGSLIVAMKYESPNSGLVPGFIHHVEVTNSILGEYALLVPQYIYDDVHYDT